MGTTLRPTRRTFLQALSAAACAGVPAACGGAPAAVNEIRIPKGAGGVGFLPLLVMEKHGLIQKHARVAGIKDLRVRWLDLGGPSVVNDALLSGSADFIAAGPPAIHHALGPDARLVGGPWRGGDDIAADVPEHPRRASQAIGRRAEKDKIAVTAVKVSIPAIIMQMYAKEKYGPSEATRFDRYTRSMTHPDGVARCCLARAASRRISRRRRFTSASAEDPRIRTIHDVRRGHGWIDDVHDVVDDECIPRTEPARSTQRSSRRSSEANAHDSRPTPRAAAELLLGLDASERGFTVDEIGRRARGSGDYLHDHARRTS